MDAARALSRMNHLESEDDAYDYAMQLATGYALPMTLKAALELKLLEIIGRTGPDAQLFPEEIVAQLPTANPDAAVMVDRILRFLSSYAVVTCRPVRDSGEKIRRRYGLAPASKFLTSESVGRLLLMTHDKIFMEGWNYITEAVLSGGMPFNKAFGTNLFEYLGTDTRFNKVFNAAMSNSSSITMKKVLETYDGFNGLGVVVDVGGGIGSTLKMIISKHPVVRGVNFDLPHVIADAPPIPGVRLIVFPRMRQALDIRLSESFIFVCSQAWST